MTYSAEAAVSLFAVCLARAGLACRLAAGDDLPLIDAMLAETLMDQLAGLPPDMAAALAEQQTLARRIGYLQRWPEPGSGGGEALITRQDEPIGHCWIVWGSSEVRLIDLALRRDLRNRGLGTLFIGSLCATADGLNLPVELSVMAYNPAARLYRRAGFVEGPTPNPAEGVFISLRRLPAPDNRQGA